MTQRYTKTDVRAKVELTNKVARDNFGVELISRVDINSPGGSGTHYEIHFANGAPTVFVHGAADACRVIDSARYALYSVAEGMARLSANA